MTESIAIIGAGIAGLATGCYGQMNGYDTHIFELHDKPGGLCTCWQRKGYTIDGCIHWLVGSSPGQNFHALWRELGAVQGREFVDHDVFARVEGSEGKVFNIYTNLDRLEQHMKELAPNDAKPIDELIGMAKTCARYDMPVDKASELIGPLEGLGMLVRYAPFIRVMSKWKKVTIPEFAARFTDPFMREALSAAFDTPQMPIVAFAMTLAWMHKKAAGQPIGGSLEFARSIERRYLDLGGKVHYRSPVQEIVVEEGRATGVRLASGEVHRADTVISAADGHATIFDMLGGKYADDTVRGYYENLPTFTPLVFVGLGVARTFEDEPAMVGFPLDEPITLGGQRVTRLVLEFSSHDPTLSPPGKTVVKLMLAADYDYWKQLSNDRASYDAEKERIADTIVSVLDRRYPGLAQQVEMRDVATPITFERYTGNWQGSFEGWLITEKTMAPFRMRKTLPGLDRFYMAGQWVEPGGGVPSGLLSGRNIIQILCKRDGKRFATSVPGAEEEGLSLIHI